MSTHIHCPELILSQMLEDVCSTCHEKCSVMTHTWIGTVMDGSKIHNTRNVQWVMSLFHTSAISNFYKHKQAQHSPQPSWKLHQLAPACWHLTEDPSRHFQWWYQPERLPHLHHSYATVSHVSSDNRFLYQCEMTVPIYEHLVIQAGRQAQDQSLPSHLQILKLSSIIYITHFCTLF